MERPLVTIIVPAYNTAEYIEDMLTCASNQTYESLQIIVIDDESTDDTLRIATRCAEKDARIDIVLTSKGGVSKARNIGIDRCRGEKVLFLDSDDTFETTLVEDCLRYAETNHVNAVLFSHAEKTNGFISASPLHEIEGNYRGEEIRQRLIPRFIGHSFDDIDCWIKGEKTMRQGKEKTALWRIMCDARTIKENNLRFDSKLTLGEDTKFMNEYLLHEDSVGFLDKCLYYLTMREGSANACNDADPALMLENKLKLIRAREGLDEIARRRHGETLRKHWEGTPVLSVFQLAIALGKDNRRGTLANWRLLKRFSKDIRVAEALESYRPARGLKGLPFTMARAHMLPLLFACCRIAPSALTGRLESGTKILQEKQQGDG